MLIFLASSIKMDFNFCFYFVVLLPMSKCLLPVPVSLYAPKIILCPFVSYVNVGCSCLWGVEPAFLCPPVSRQVGPMWGCLFASLVWAESMFLYLKIQLLTGGPSSTSPALSRSQWHCSPCPFEPGVVTLPLLLEPGVHHPWGFPNPALVSAESLQ